MTFSKKKSLSVHKKKCLYRTREREDLFSQESRRESKKYIPHNVVCTLCRV